MSIVGDEAGGDGDYRFGACARTRCFDEIEAYRRLSLSPKGGFLYVITHFCRRLTPFLLSQERSDIWPGICLLSALGTPRAQVFDLLVDAREPCPDPASPMCHKCVGRGCRDRVWSGEVCQCRVRIGKG